MKPIFLDLKWGTAVAEIKVSSVESPELTNVLPLKPGGGQNIAKLASPTARNFFLVLISILPVHSPFIPPPPPPPMKSTGCWLVKRV